MEEKFIVMKTSDLNELLKQAQRYRYYYVYDSEQNTDGQGEWHCDVWLSDEYKLGEGDWGEGEDIFSFDEATEENIKKARKIEVKHVYEEPLSNLPWLKTLGDFKRHQEALKDQFKLKVFMKDGELWLRKTKI